MALSLLLNALVSGAHICLVALGFGLVYRAGRFFHLGHAAPYAVGAYVGFWIGTVLAGGVALALGAGAAAAALTGAVMDLTLFRPLRRRRVSGLGQMLASLGSLIVIQNLLSLAFGDDIKAPRWGAADSVRWMWEGIAVSPAQALLVATAVVAAGIVSLALKRTRLGLVVRAVGSDPRLASVFGLPSDAAILAAFIVGSGLAGIAGVLWSYATGLAPPTAFQALLSAVVAVITGGVNSVLGTVIAAFGIGAAQQLGMWRFGSEWQDPFLYAILLLFFLLRSRGLLEKRPHPTDA